MELVKVPVENKKENSTKSDLPNKKPKEKKDLPGLYTKSLDVDILDKYNLTALAKFGEKADAQLKTLQVKKDKTILPQLVVTKDGRKILCIQKSILDTYNVLDGLIAKFITPLSIDEVRLIPDGDTTNTLDNGDCAKVIYGMMLAIDDDKPVKLKKAKLALEFGRTVGFALRLRGHVRNRLNTLKGVSILKKDQTFFGNGRLSSVENGEFFYIKKFFEQNFTDKEIGQAYGELIATLFEHLALDNFLEPAYQKALKDNVMTFDDAVASFVNRPEIKKKIPEAKGKKKKVVAVTEKATVRVGRKPATSPLLLKKELELIRQLMTPIWRQIDSIRAEWDEKLRTGQIDDAIESLKQHYKRRFEILQAFASVTTKRLQGIRALEGNSLLKKASISKEMLERYSNSIGSKSDTFIQELKFIFGSNYDFVRRSLFPKAISNGTADADIVAAFKAKVDAVYTGVDISAQINAIEDKPSPLLPEEIEKGKKFAILLSNVLEAQKQTIIRYCKAVGREITTYDGPRLEKLLGWTETKEKAEKFFRTLSAQKDHLILEVIKGSVRGIDNSVMNCVQLFTSILDKHVWTKDTSCEKLVKAMKAGERKTALLTSLNHPGWK